MNIHHIWACISFPPLGLLRLSNSCMYLISSTNKTLINNNNFKKDWLNQPFMESTYIKIHNLSGFDNISIIFLWSYFTKINDTTVPMQIIKRFEIQNHFNQITDNLISDHLKTCERLINQILQWSLTKSLKVIQRLTLSPKYTKLSCQHNLPNSLIQTRTWFNKMRQD